VKSALLFCTKLLLLLSLINLLPAFHYLIEINKSAGTYYLAAHVTAFVLLILLRSRRSAVLHLFLAAFYGMYLVPYYVSTGEESVRVCDLTPDACTRFKILYANVNAFSSPSSALPDLISSENPDVVAIVELTPSWNAGLALESKYPYRISIPEPHCFGLGLFSKFPISGTPVTEIGEDVPRVIVTELEVSPGRTLEFTVFHGLPPSETSMVLNKLITRRLLTILKHDDKEGIVVADMNATPFSGFYRPFLWAAGFSNAMHGRGLYRTWNATSELLRFTIDHVLYRGEVKVRSARVGDTIGSDHLPLIVEFETPKKLPEKWKLPLKERRPFLPF
jgi:endonuclease/exonuclease/phosphatase (EEP) superfamily protein YafD